MGCVHVRFEHSLGDCVSKRSWVQICVSPNPRLDRRVSDDHTKGSQMGIWVLFCFVFDCLGHKGFFSQPDIRKRDFIGDNFPSLFPPPHVLVVKYQRRLCSLSGGRLKQYVFPAQSRAPVGVPRVDIGRVT